MRIEKLVELLLEVKAAYPSLEKLEIIELMKLKTMMEAKARDGRG